MPTHRPSLVADAAKILVVDDDQNCVLGLLRLLESLGYSEAVGMTDPRKAIAALETMRPDLVLLDWHMEGADGAEVLLALEELCHEGSCPPVIVLTGDERPDTKRMAFGAGAADFLTKPFDETEAAARIRNQLRLHKLNQHALSEKARLETMVHARTAQLREKAEESKRLQQQVIAEERMRAFVSMAGGVAHDFNNALTVIRGYSDLYSEVSPGVCSAEDMQAAFQFIALAAHDATEIVRRLREFYRPFDVSDHHQSLDLHRLVEESIALSRPNWKTKCQANGVNVTVRAELQSCSPISACATELREVLLNLIFNSVDAMPQGGSIIVRAREQGERAILEVEDNGIGMTEETQKRCLEPFYTTKGKNGTGLGLSIVYGIVQRHGGSIKIQSAVNEGTTISICLPRQSAHAEDEAPLLSLPVRQHLRILIVDDDPHVCTVVSRYLEADEHSVTTAANGCEALEKFGNGEFDLVIADRVMPKMSGDQLATAIKQIRPAEPIILMSGYDGTATGAFASILINKPVTMSELRDAISRVMVA